MCWSNAGRLISADSIADPALAAAQAVTSTSATNECRRNHGCSLSAILIHELPISRRAHAQQQLPWCYAALVWQIQPGAVFEKHPQVPWGRSLFEQAVQRRLSFGVLEVHVCAGFKQSPGGIEATPFDRKHEWCVIALRVHLGAGADKKLYGIRTIVESRSPHAVFGIGAAFDQERGKLKVLSMTYGVPERRCLSVALCECRLIDIERRVQEHGGHLDAV